MPFRSGPGRVGHDTATARRAGEDQPGVASSDGGDAMRRAAVRVSRAALLLGDLRHDHPRIGRQIDPILWLLAEHRAEVDDDCLEGLAIPFPPQHVQTVNRGGRQASYVPWAVVQQRLLGMGTIRDDR